VEVWENEQLIGGIYGVSVGRLFCGESMFSARSGASRLALVTLARLLHQLDCPLLDAQVANAHTLGLGAMEIPRTDFLRHVERLTRFSSTAESWTGLLEALPPVF
jgi:leucyl/phenylalanyl-tRNA--protein transferase